MFKMKLMAAAMVLALSSTVHAGGASSGGASEVTQIMNNGELVASVSKQSMLVAGQIRDYTAQINQYMTMLQNLKQLPLALVAKTLAPYKEQLRALGELYKATNEVYTSSTDAYEVIQRRRAEMENLSLDPSEYLNSEFLLAQAKGGIYKEQANRDIAAFKKAEEKSKVLAGMEAQIGAVSGNVEGLQLLAQQNQMMAGELMELNAQLREKSLQDNMAKEQAMMSAAAVKEKSKQTAAQLSATKAATTGAISSGGKYTADEERKSLLEKVIH